MVLMQAKSGRRTTWRSSVSPRASFTRSGHRRAAGDQPPWRRLCSLGRRRRRW